LLTVSPILQPQHTSVRGVFAEALAAVFIPELLCKLLLQPTANYWSLFVLSRGYSKVMTGPVGLLCAVVGWCPYDCETRAWHCVWCGIILAVAVRPDELHRHALAVSCVSFRRASFTFGKVCATDTCSSVCARRCPGILHTIAVRCAVKFESQGTAFGPGLVQCLELIDKGNSSRVS
jgi:hypothetical protein